MEIDYNTTRNHIEIKEYGRHIQRMIEYTKQISDVEKRQKAANTIVELMGYFNPQLKNMEGFRQKLWDHLFIIANYDVDVKSPYPIPTNENVQRKRDRLEYPKRHPKFLHLGKNIEYIIEKAKFTSDPYKKQFFIHIIINCMKQAYEIWHKDNVHEDSLKQELQSLTRGILLYEHNSDIHKMLKDEKGERQEKEIKKTERFFNNGKKKHKHNNNNSNFTHSNNNHNPNPNQSAKLNNNPNKNYNNSNSSNVSIALPPKKNKFKRYK